MKNISIFQVMRPLDTQVFHRLTRLYVIALTTVAVLSMSGQLLIQLFLNELLDDAHVVNIAGRQRMLSQKLSKTAVLLCRPEVFQADAEYYSQDIIDITNLWSKSHYGLKNGSLTAEKTISVKNSPKIDSMFQRLDPIFGVMYSNARLISQTIQAPSKNKNEVLQKALNHILINERTYLKMMNDIVFEYDLEAQSRVDRTKRIELILFILLFTVLLLEGVLIFRPIANYIRVVIRKLTDSESQLQQINETLVKTNDSLVQTRKELVAATEEKYKFQLAEEKVRSSSLLEGQEVERKRLARELHDGIGQMLTGLRLHSEHLKSFSFSSEKQNKSFEDLQTLIGETIEATRMVSFNLAPAVLSDFGIAPAVRILTEQVSKIAGLPIEFSGSKLNRLPEKIEIGLYRITQEAIHNAVKYAEASKIKVQLSAKNGFVTLEIADNGKGFDPSKIKLSAEKRLGGSGIKNMQTRTELLNGKFKIESRAGKGTKLIVELPLD